MWPVANEDVESRGHVRADLTVPLLCFPCSFRLLSPRRFGLLGRDERWLSDVQSHTAAAARTPTNYPFVINQPQKQKRTLLLFTLSPGPGARLQAAQTNRVPVKPYVHRNIPLAVCGESTCQPPVLVIRWCSFSPLQGSEIVTFHL